MSIVDSTFLVFSSLTFFNYFPKIHFINKVISFKNKSKNDYFNGTYKLSRGESFAFSCFSAIFAKSTGIEIRESSFLRESSFNAKFQKVKFKKLLDERNAFDVFE